MIKIRKVIGPVFYNRSYLFCQAQKKSYVMPERPKRPQVHLVNKIHFINGRHLIYLNKQKLLTPYLLDMYLIVPMAYIGYLIANNPFYLTFPAALPLMMVAEAILLLAWIGKKSQHKRHIERIYLLQSFQLQFVYANKIRRYLKDNEASQIFDVDNFQPIYDDEIDKGITKAYPGLRIPKDTSKPLSKSNQPHLLQYGWTFRDKMFNIFILPSKFEYANEQILLRVLNGIPCVCNTVDVTFEGAFTFSNYPSIEEEFARLPKLQGQTENEQNREAIAKGETINEEK